MPATGQMTQALTEATTLPDFGIAVGLVMIDGIGSRVGTLDADGLRWHSPDEARQIAWALARGDCADVLAPAIEALRETADKIEAFAYAEPQGSA